jgi:PRTRC genetic system protein C
MAEEKEPTTQEEAPQPAAEAPKARVFHYDGRDFPDPDPTMSPEDVKSMFVDFFPELANADIKEHKRDADIMYEFVRKVGTKGD